MSFKSSWVIWGQQPSCPYLAYLPMYLLMYLTELHILFNAAYLLVNYNLLFYTTSCNFYDPKLDDFSATGCTVGTCSNPMVTQCLCNHLTSFSSSFNMPKLKTKVNPLGTSGAVEAFSLTSLNQNPVCLAFCIACLCVYIILFVIALRFDLHDRQWVSKQSYASIVFFFSII